MTPKPYVEVCLRDGRLWLQGAATTTQGWHWMTGDAVNATWPCDDLTLGQEVLGTMTAAMYVIPQPTREEMKAQAEWKNFLRTVGVRSGAAWHRGNRRAAVYDLRGRLMVNAYLNNGGKAGFAVIPGTKPVDVTGASAEELGAAVRDALARALDDVETAALGK